jgi:hypothetical protein
MGRYFLNFFLKKTTHKLKGKIKEIELKTEIEDDNSRILN